MHCSTAGFCKPFNQVTVHVLMCTADDCLMHSHLLCFRICLHDVIVEEVRQTEPFQFFSTAVASVQVLEWASG